MNPEQEPNDLLFGRPIPLVWPRKMHRFPGVSFCLASLSDVSLDELRQQKTMGDLAATTPNYKQSLVRLGPC